MKTYSAKPSQVTRDWYVIDASETTLGRIATHAASLLLGKHKTMFTKHIDCGDFVVIINSDKLNFTGGKLNQKIYYRHSSYPGGLHSKLLKDKMVDNSEDVVFKAVRGMLPDNKLRKARLERLKIYKNESHNHLAQSPKPFSPLKERK